jgi:hypothetical protein
MFPAVDTLLITEQAMSSTVQDFSLETKKRKREDDDGDKKDDD